MIAPPSAVTTSLPSSSVVVTSRLVAATSVGSPTADAELAPSESRGESSLDLEGIRVTLSELGKSKSAESEKNQDIDDSNLPDLIKQMLKLIRDLKQQIDQKMVELQAVTGDKGMTPDEQQVRMQALQSELATLNGALSSAYGSLATAMRDMQLSSADMQTAMELLL